MIWCGYKQINTVSIRKRFSISASEMPLLDEYEPPPGNSSLSLSPPDLSTLFHLRPPSTRWVPIRPMWQLCATMMSWVGCFLKDSELFILFEENIQILLKISVIPILLTFIYLVALNLKQPTQPIVQLNSSLRHIIVTYTTNWMIFFLTLVHCIFYLTSFKRLEQKSFRWFFGSFEDTKRTFWKSTDL